MRLMEWINLFHQINSIYMFTFILEFGLQPTKDIDGHTRLINLNIYNK